MIRHAVIPAAGLGTRFLPATKAQPKEMLPIVDKPTIQFVVEEAVASGISDILIITGRGKRSIEDHFDKSYELEEYLRKKGERKLLEEVERVSSLASIHYVRQREQRGLGDAVLCAAEHVDGKPFALLLGDTIVDAKAPCTRQLMEKYLKYKGSVIAVEEVRRENISKYGIIDGKRLSEGGDYLISSLVEKPAAEKAPSNLGIIGRYILTPEIFGELRNTKAGRGGELQLTDALNSLCRKQKTYACTFEGERFDIGNKLDYAKAFVKLGVQRKDFGGEFREFVSKLV